MKDINVPARYGSEASSLSIRKVLAQFPFKLLAGPLKRISLKYFLYAFNMASVYLLIGLPMFPISAFFGVLEWIDSVVSGIPRTAGTIVLVALPIIISFQMLLQAIQEDIHSVPRKETRPTELRPRND